MANTLMGVMTDSETRGQFYMSSLPQPSLIFQRAADNPSINVLPDNVLLEVFNRFRLHSLHTWECGGWYKLAHTCRRWRLIIFASPSLLNLQLYCTYGTPVADMLRHSPPLPLSVNYHEGAQQSFTPKDEEGTLLALRKHDRVRYIDLCAPLATLDKIFAVMNGSFPLLEHLALSVDHSGTNEDERDSYLFDHALPQAFRAPHLRHLDLNRVGDVAQVNLPLLASLSGLISLTLIGVPFSAFLSIDYLASRLSLMPQLECLGLGFDSYVPMDDPDLESEPIVAQNVKQIPFPNLFEIFFKGTSSYLEALAAQISAPLLKTFTAQFFDQPSSSLPHLSQLLSAAAELRLPVASIKFSGFGVDDPNVVICMAGSESTLDWWPNFAPFQIMFPCDSLSEQVTSTRQICASLSPMLSAVERLHLSLSEARPLLNLDERRWQLVEVFDIEDDAWHNLLRPFCSVKKLQTDEGMMGALSYALSDNDNGPSMEILPELCKLTRPHDTRFCNTFHDLIASRQNAGRHITKRRRLPNRRSLWKYGGLGASKDKEDEDKEREDMDMVERGVGDERKEAEEAHREANTEVDPDSDSGSFDDLTFSTDLDSDSDFNFECTFNQRRARFAVFT